MHLMNVIHCLDYLIGTPFDHQVHSLLIIYIYSQRQTGSSLINGYRRKKTSKAIHFLSPTITTVHLHFYIILISTLPVSHSYCNPMMLLPLAQIRRLSGEVDPENRHYPLYRGYFSSSTFACHFDCFAFLGIKFQSKMQKQNMFICCCNKWDQFV